jgi:hypothetical protein
MSVPPIALGIYFCSRLEVDAARREVSLEGLFSSRAFNQFPSPLVPLSFFSYLSGGRGEGNLQLEIFRIFADGRTQGIWRQKRWVRFPDDPMIPVPVHFLARKLSFPGAGDYLVQLSFDGQSICDRQLRVRSS